MELRLPTLNPNSFAQNLTFTCDILGISRVELSERTGIPLAITDQILQGQRKPDLDMLCAILSVVPAKFERLVR